MSSGSEAVLYDIYGDPMAVEVDTAIPAGTATLITGGSDGTNARFIKVDTSGNQVMVGLGTAGSPSGGVLTIQGDPSGTPAPISGTVTANAGSGNFSVVQATAALLNATVIGTVTANIGTSGALALDATLSKLTITPGTALGSNTLAMVGGHVTTVSPTYTNGNINQLSLTTAGALRIDGSNVIHPVSQSGTWTVQQGTPPWSVIGPGASGAALSGNPVRVAGSDGTNTRNIVTDTSGRLLVSGATADGAAVTGNPVLIGGQDGTNAQTILTDTSGRQQVVGAAADGAAVTGNPVLIAGQDGINAQSILTDTAGRQVMVGAAADGAAVTGNPVLIGGTDGTNTQTIELRNTHPVGDVQGIIVRNIRATNPTFYAVFDRITLSENKYLATLFNTSSTRKVVIQRVWVYNWQSDTVNGANGDSVLWKITARTAGTTVTPRAEDSNDTLSAGISADTNTTVVTQDHLIMRILHSGDETNLANANWVNAAIFPINALRYERKDGNRGITLRQNQGVSLQWLTGDADGTWSIVYEFTDEVA